VTKSDGGYQEYSCLQDIKMATQSDKAFCLLKLSATKSVAAL
jgi:hypothetical protein